MFVIKSLFLEQSIVLFALPFPGPTTRWATQVKSCQIGALRLLTHDERLRACPCSLSSTQVTRSAAAAASTAAAAMTFTTTSAAEERCARGVWSYRRQKADRERRPCCRVYVIKNRAAPAASQKTSRSSAGMAGIGSFFGGSASSLAAVDITPKQRAPRGGAFKSLPRGGGSRGGGSSLGAAALEAAAVVAADAKGNHPQARKAQRPRKMPGLLASGRRRVRRARRAKQARRAAAGAGQQLALFTIGAEHAELKQEDGGSSQPSKEAKAGDINVDTMSAMEHETES